MLRVKECIELVWPLYTQDWGECNHLSGDTKLTIHRFGSGEMPFSGRHATDHYKTAYILKSVLIASAENKTFYRILHSINQRNIKNMTGVAP